MISGWSCEVCGGPQRADEEGNLIESQCDVRFHLLWERIEKIEAELAAVRKTHADEASVPTTEDEL